MQSTSHGREPIKSETSTSPQAEQLELDTLNRIFEMDSDRVRPNGYFEQLAYRVSFDTIRVEINRNTDEARTKILEPNPTFTYSITAEDPNGVKRWDVDKAGLAEPVHAKLNSQSLANRYDMSHLSVEKIIGYVVDEHVRQS